MSINPRLSLWKRLFFFQAQPLIEIARQRIVQEADALPLPVERSDQASNKIEKNFNFSSGSSLIWSSMRAPGRRIHGAMFFYLSYVLLGLTIPVFVNHFVKSLQAVGGASVSMGIGLSLAAITIIQGLFLQQYYYRILGVFQLVDNIINKKIYFHSLRLSLKARSQTSVGDIVNHMGTDSHAIGDFSFAFLELMEAVLTTIGVSALLFFYLGWTALVPLILFLVLLPTTQRLAKRFSHLDDEMMKWRDHRVSLMTQVLSAIRLVKFFVWEKSVYKEVDALREKELKARKKMAQTEVLSRAAYTSVGAVVLFIALGTHALRGLPLDPALVFTCISLFGLLENPLGHLSNLLSRVSNSFVSAKRVVQFLSRDTISVREDNDELADQPPGLSVKGLSVSYGTPQECVLSNLNFELAAGQSLAVIGPVGAGKSTFLLNLLNEVPCLEGSFSWTGIEAKNPRQVFCPQESYIINGSLRENLAFGEKVSDEQVHQALKLTGLNHDMRLFPAGLDTEIGEKGVNLSGGQKQRVALARAFLASPRLVILDDPLSAVDVETEKHLAENLIFGAWQGVTRIVATHRMEHLDRFDKILFLDDSEIKAFGSFDDIKNDPVFLSFYSAHHHIQNAERSVSMATEAAKPPETSHRLTDDEERETGAVKSQVYGDYILSLGGKGRWRFLNIFLLALGSVSIVAFPLAQKAWLGQMQSNDALYAVGVYGLIGLATLFVTLVNGLFWLHRGVAAGQNLHNDMLSSILGAPIRFFDATPIGRILQRFSRDIESVDVYLQWTFDSAINCFMEVLVTLILIGLVLPLTFFVIAPVLIIFYFVQDDYRRPAREFKRLDAMARSPRFAHFKETLMGLNVIRGFRKEAWFIEGFFARLNHSQKIFYNHYLLNRWFSVRIPLLGGMLAGTTTVFIALTVHAGQLSAGVGGLLVIYALSFWTYLNWGVRMFADIESRMTSVERLKFYSRLPQEVAAEGDEISNWPQTGHVHFRNISVRYAKHLPLVLKNIDIEIRSGERVGLIGRTGSGKSTLLQTLFRFVDLEEGQIFIDGKDIWKIPLSQLRRNLAIIPQDPILFMGTIRSNLDRYQQFSDQELERALKEAFLWAFVSQLPGGLQYQVAENGSNFSQGQRQLLCLARALLVKAKVIVLDEATASVDAQTDLAIQKVIHQGLRGVTLIVIAHRLGTVIDCDRVVELAQGRVKDVWRPQEKRKDAQSQFLFDGSSV